MGRQLGGRAADFRRFVANALIRGPIVYEQKHRPLLSRVEFAKRVGRRFILALLVLGVALGIGVLGYRYLGGLNWIDSLLNASMILGGMGPVDPLHSDAAKIFASCYALFSGLAFIGIASLLVAPFAHRFLHRFHLEGK
jgi:hypothetical protein